MDKIKIINTGKCKLIAVMVPEGAHSFRLIHKETKISWLLEDRLFHATLQKGNWQILGLSTELTEEQCRALNLMPAIRPKYGDPYEYTPAKECLSNLMIQHQIYSVNPYTKPNECDCGGYIESCGGCMDSLPGIKWQEAESNTGRWLTLILRQS